MTMDLANYHLALVLMFSIISNSFSDYSGVSFLLIRSNSDEFNKPSAGRCEARFCTDANSVCASASDCCQCTCRDRYSTFDTSTMKCRLNTELRSDCNVTFKKTYRDSQIKLLNFSAKKKKATINWIALYPNDEIKSFKITRITFYESGKAVRPKFLSKKGEVKRARGLWKTKIEWNNVPNKYEGKLFKVFVSYIIERQVWVITTSLPRTDCFVFKSSGSTTVSFPSLQPSSVIRKKSTLLERAKLSAPLIPSSSIPSSLSKVQTTTTLLRKTTVMVEVPLASSSLKESLILDVTKTKIRKSSTWENKEATTTEIPIPHIKLSTSKAVVEQSTVVTSPDNKQQSNDNEGSNAIVVSLTVVGAVVILIAVILVVLWSRRRSSNPSKKQRGTLLSNRGTRTGDNTLTMSPLENIYAEVDNDMNRSNAKVNCLIYDSADGVDENGYAQLDKSKNEQRPKYQSLVNRHANSYENVAGNTTLSNQNGRPTTAEPVYNVLDVADQVPDPCVIYHVLDETPEAPNRELPARTGDENETNVYSVLEDENTQAVDSSDLMVLPEKSDYEQPLHATAPDT